MNSLSIFVKWYLIAFHGAIPLPYVIYIREVFLSSKWGEKLHWLIEHYERDLETFWSLVQKSYLLC